MEKINEMVRREISMILQRDMQDPRMSFVSITQVVVSPDLYVARVSFSVLGGEQKSEEIAAVLNNASGYIRRLIGQRVALRLTPRIEFEYDRSLEYSARIEQKIREIHRQDDANDKNSK